MLYRFQDIARYNWPKIAFYPTVGYLTSPLMGSLWNFVTLDGLKIRMMGLPELHKLTIIIFSRFDTIHECGTDRQTPDDLVYSMYSVARKTVTYYTAR